VELCHGKYKIGDIAYQRPSSKKNNERHDMHMNSVFIPSQPIFFHCAIFDSLFHFDELCANEKMGYDELGVLGHQWLLK